MNKANFEKLHAHLCWLRDNGKARKFDMAHWLQHPRLNCAFVKVADLASALEDCGIDEPISATECGTIACLAGHAALIGGCGPLKDVESFAKDWLGLDNYEVEHLFYSGWSDCLLWPSLGEAIAELARIIETGRVMT